MEENNAIPPDVEEGLESSMDKIMCSPRWLFGALAVAALIFCTLELFRNMGYSVVRKEPEIRWLPHPLTYDTDAQGNVTGYIVLGVDSKGVAHLGHAPYQAPATAPAGPTAPSVVPTTNPTKQKR